MNKQNWDFNHWLRSGSVLKWGKDTYLLGLGPFQTVSDANESGTLWCIPESFYKIEKHDLFKSRDDFLVEKNALLKRFSPRDVEKPNWEPPHRDLFNKQFSDVRSSIDQGRIRKAVPYAFERADFEVGERVVEYWLSRGLRDLGQGHLFGAWDLGQGWGTLGFSPELLFELNQQVVSTMALAGTAKGPEHNLLDDSKEMSEHKIVVDDIGSILSRYGKLKVGPPTLWKPSQLTHLKTEISAAVGTVNPFELLLALHPTPALGGAPRELAVELLKTYEELQPRYSFGAPFGVFNFEQKSKVVVQIRNLIWHHRNLLLGSGCGVVEQSSLENEWNELERKRQSVKSIFGVEDLE